MPQGSQQIISPSLQQSDLTIIARSTLVNFHAGNIAHSFLRIRPTKRCMRLGQHIPILPEDLRHLIDGFLIHIRRDEQRQPDGRGGRNRCLRESPLLHTTDTFP